MSYNDSSYALYQGSFYLQERSLNGADLTGYQFVGDVDMFTIDPKQKFEDIEESQTGLGLTAAHILTGTSVTSKFRALDTKFANWIRATWGGGGTAVAGGSVTGESIVLYNGQVTKLAHPGVSSLVLSVGPAAVVNTDYTVDTVNGTIAVLAASTVIVAGTPQTYTAAYTKAAYGGKVQAFVTGQRYYRALLVGRNVAQGNQPVHVICNQISFDMAKSLSLIDKKHVNFEMDGMLLQDTLIATPVTSTDLSQFFSVTKA
jgi:hypothetical protein